MTDHPVERNSSHDRKTAFAHSLTMVMTMMNTNRVTDWEKRSFSSWFLLKGDSLHSLFAPLSLNRDTPKKWKINAIDQPKKVLNALIFKLLKVSNNATGKKRSKVINYRLETVLLTIFGNFERFSSPPSNSKTKLIFVALRVIFIIPRSVSS